MNAATLLRAALVPIGLALAGRGISLMQEQADELRQLVDDRRAYLAGDGPLPDVDQPADVDEHQDDAPEQLEVFRITGNGNPVTRRRRRWPLWAVLGVGVGYVAARAAVELAARAELAAAESADITAALMAQPPAPGSPADIAARDPWDTVRSLRLVDEDAPTPAAPTGRDLADVDERADRVAAVATGRACSQCLQDYPAGYGEVQKTLHRAQFCPRRPAGLPE